MQVEIKLSDEDFWDALIERTCKRLNVTRNQITHVQVKMEANSPNKIDVPGWKIEGKTSPVFTATVEMNPQPVEHVTSPYRESAVKKT